MTRLRKEQVREIGRNLHQYDRDLVKVTGLTLKQTALRAAGLSAEEMSEALASNPVAVVSMTCGEGAIEGFAEAVRDILSHLGARVFQPEATDVTGIAEVVEKGADILFFADDQRFIALHLSLRRVVDNREATARGYVEALEGASGGLKDREVLVIGAAGGVGWHATRFLQEKQACVSVYDLDEVRLIPRLEGQKVRFERDLEKALKRYRILLDATPASGIIGIRHLAADTIIAAPGIPLGLTEAACRMVQGRLIHDPLQIGVATMLSEVIST